MGIGAREARHASAIEWPHRERMIILSDPSTITVAARELESSYELLAPESLGQALRLFNSDERVVAVVTESRLASGIDGIELLRLIKARRRGSITVLLVADVGEELDRVLRAGCIDVLLARPWSRGALRCAVDEWRERR